MSSKAQQFVPRLLPGVDPSALPVALTESEQTLLSHVDGDRSLADIQAASALGLKELLLNAKSLAKKQIIQLVKRTEDKAAAPAKLPASSPSSELPQGTDPQAGLGTVEVKQKKLGVDDMAVFERNQTERRKASIQTGRAKLPNATLDALEARKRPKPTAQPRGLMRSLHASPLSAEIDRLLQDDEKEAPATAPIPASAPLSAPAPAQDPGSTMESTPTTSAIQQRQQAAIALETPGSAGFVPGQEPEPWPDETSATNEDLLAYPEGALELPLEEEFSFETAQRADEPSGSHESLEADLPLEAELPMELDLLEVPGAQHSQPVSHHPPPPSHTPSELLATPPRRPTLDITENLPADIRTEDLLLHTDDLELIGIDDIEVDKTSEVRKISDIYKTDEIQHLGMNNQTQEVPKIKEPPRRPSQQEEDPFDLEELEAQASLLPADAPPQYILASQIMTSFTRVIATFRLYDARNNAVKDALAQLYQQLRQYLDKYDALDLKVSPWTFLCDEHNVYANNDRESSLSFKLYRDGIRGLQFVPGFDGAQLVTLLQILASAQSHIRRTEDDLVTLFWKAALPHATITAVEGFKLRGDETSAPPLERLFERTTESGSHDRLPQSDDAFSLEAFVAQEQPQQWLSRLSVSAAQYSPISATACEQFQREGAPERWPRALPTLFDTFESWLNSASDAKESEALTQDASRWLRDCAAAMLQEGHIARLTALLQRSRRWQTEGSPGLQEAAAAVQTVLGEPDRLKQLFHRVTQGPDEPLPHEWLQLFRSSPVDSTPALFQLLEQPLGAPSKGAIRQLLVALAEGDLTPFASRLESTSTEPEVCVEMIECLKQIGTQEAFALIGAQINHSSPRVQDAVLQMAELLSKSGKGSANIRQVVSKLIASDDPLQRGRAYKVMEQSHDGRWATTLHKHLHDDPNLDRDELEAIARLAARLNPDATLPVVAALANPPGRLGMERSQRKHQRFAAIQALAEIGNLGAEETLRKLIKSHHNDTKELAINAMRELRRNQHGHTPIPTSPSSERDAGGPGPAGGASDHHKGSSEPKSEGFDALHQQMVDVLEQIDLQSEDATQGHLRDDGAAFVSLLHVLLKTAALYDANNQIFERPIRELLDVQTRLIALLPEVTIVGIEDQFYIDDLRVRMQSANVQQACRELCAEFRALSLGGMVFLAPLGPDEWRSFAQLYAGKHEDKAEQWQHLRDQLQRAGLGQKVELFGEVTYQVGEEKQEQSLVHIYARGLEAIHGLWSSVVQGRQPATLPVRRALQPYADLLGRRPDLRLSVLAFEDPAQPLKTHLLNTALLAMAIGQSVGLPRNSLVDLGVSAACHDLGHIRPDQRDHKQRGVQRMLQQPFQPTMTQRMLVALEHHEPYTPPESLDEEPSPSLDSRIIHIADMYDTLTTPALAEGIQVSPAKLTQRFASDQGQLFDPTLAQALFNCLGSHPVGTMFELDDGAFALSLGSRNHPDAFDRPSCLVVKKGDGGTRFGQEIDLEDPAHRHRHILRYHTPSPEQSPRRTLAEHIRRSVE